MQWVPSKCLSSRWLITSKQKDSGRPFCHFFTKKETSAVGRAPPYTRLTRGESVAPPASGSPAVVTPAPLSQQGAETGTAGILAARWHFPRSTGTQSAAVTGEEGGLLGDLVTRPDPCPETRTAAMNQAIMLAVNLVFQALLLKHGLAVTALKGK